MRRILIVNPNTTVSMTRAINKTAQAVRASNFEIKTINPKMGPESIEGYYDEAFSVPGLLYEISRHHDWDGFIISCFDDTGLDAARSLVAGPVIGIGEAAYHVAALIGNKFSVITSLSRSIPVLEQNLVKYGLDNRCSGIHACEVEVLALEKNLNATKTALSEKIIKIKDREMADVIVLGCAGMTNLAEDLTMEHEIPIVDGVTAAVELTSALIRMGLRTGKRNGYAYPNSKLYLGEFSKFAPK